MRNAIEVTTITSKGQVTMPSFIRNKLKVQPGDKFLWTLSDGEIKLCKLDAVEVLRETIGAEFRRLRTTPEQLHTILEEARAEYCKDQSVN
ncbi:MAG: hypothetical protein PHT33_07420 [bacterium]|nr:hypothetical protein [bacterium]